MLMKKGFLLLCCLCCALWSLGQVSPAAPTVSGNTTICTGSSTTLTASGQTGATFAWWTAAVGGTSLATTPDYVVPTQATAGTYHYYVEQIVGGQASARADVVLTVNAMPQLTVGAAATVPEGSIVNLTATTNAGNTPNWITSQGNYGPLTGTSAFVVPTENTTTYTAFASDNGCTASAATAITVSRLPTVSGTLQVCPNTSTTLTAAGTGPFVWYDAAIGGTTLFTGATYTTPVLQKSTSYWVADNGGPRKEVKVFVPTAANLPEITAKPAVICAGDTSRLGGSGYPGVLTWYTTPTGGTSIGTSTATTPLAVTPSVTTTYYAEATPQQSSITFNATGAVQTWTVPANVTSINVTAYGAKSFGWGGGVQTTLNVTPGQVLYLYVGTSSGWNGGGTGIPVNLGSGSNGAGATDIRINGQDLVNRVVVAGGGGGCAYYNYPIMSWSGGRGDGGGLAGQDGPYYISSTNFGGTPSAYHNAVGWGGTQAYGGRGYTVWGQPWNGHGGFGYGGGSPGTATFIVGCGGGGWYGGGASGEAIRYGGGGGSNYANPQLCQNIVHTQGANNGEGKITITYGVTCAGVTTTRMPVVVTVPSFFKPAGLASAAVPCAGSPLTLSVSGFAPSREVGAFSGSQPQAGTSGIPSVTNDFTLDFWVKPTDSIALVTPTANTTAGTSGQRFAVFPEQGGNNAGAGVSVGKNGVQVCEHGNSYLPVVLSFKGPIPDTTFTHVAVVYNSKTPSLYINGALVATGLTSPRASVYPSTGSGGVGGYGPFKGQMDNVRIWAAALTGSEIQGILSRSDTLISGKPLAARYSFDGGSLADDQGVPQKPSWNTLTSAPQQDYRTYNWTSNNAVPSINKTNETQTATIDAIPPDTRPYYFVNVGSGGCSSAASDTLFPNIGNVPTASVTGPAFSCQGTDTTIVLQAFSAKAPFTFSYSLNGGPTQTATTTAQRIRYIRLRQNAADCFHLSEVRAMDYATGLNVALGKTVTASSSSAGNPVGNLTDGNVGNKWHSNGCSGGEYVEIDLGAAYRLDNIQLVNRQDCCWERAQNLQLILKDSSGAQLSSRTINAYQGMNSGYTTRWPAEVVSLPLPTAVSGTYQYTLQSVTSNLGCTNTQSSSLTATVLSPVAPSIQLTTNTGNELCAGTPVIFTAIVADTAAATYAWYLNGAPAGTDLSYTSPAIKDQDSIAFVAVNTRGCTAPAGKAFLKMRLNTPLADSIVGNTCGLNPLVARFSTTPYSLAWQQNGTSVVSRISAWSNPATAATVSSTAHLFVDTAGNLYVPETSANRVTRWAPGATTGVVVAGGNGSGAAANQLNNPLSVYVSDAGDVYVADAGNHRVQRWSAGATSGVSVAGTSGISGNGAGQLSNPTDITVDAGGNLFIADYGNHRVQRWAPGDTTGRTVAGSASGISGATAALLYHPYGVAVDKYGSVLVADQDNHRIVKWAAGSSVGTVLLGNGTAGSGSAALNNPAGVAVDGMGNIYVADAANHRIQRQDTGSAAAVTIAGTGTSGSGTTQLNNPMGLALTRSGTLFLSDAGNNRIQTYTPAVDSVYTPASYGRSNVVATSFDGCTSTSPDLFVNTPVIMGPTALFACQNSDTALLVSGFNALPPYAFTYSLNGGAPQTVNSTIRKVRYVRLTQNTNYYLNIGELRILDFWGNNIALGKSVTASAIYNNNSNAYGASNINDGKNWTAFRSGYLGNGNSATFKGGYAEIDLGSEYAVQQVSLFVDQVPLNYQLRVKNLTLTFKDSNGAVVYTQPVDATVNNNLPATTLWPLPQSATNTARIPVSASALGTQNYTFTTVTGAGCAATTNTTIALTVTPRAAVTTLPAVVPACDGTPLNVTPSITGATSYQWLKDGDLSVGDTGLSYNRITASTANNGIYRVVMTTAAGCVDTSVPVAVVVAAPPTATIAGGATVCQFAPAAPLTLTGNAGFAPYTFAYSANGGAAQTGTSGLAKVRYVRVKQNNTIDNMNLAEIGVIEAISGNNLALNKPATTSSTLSGFPLSNINDGNLSNFWHSNAGNNTEYVEIDLGSPGYDLAAVRITNRGDCCQDRSQDLQLILKDSAGVQLLSQNINAYQGQNKGYTSVFPAAVGLPLQVAAPTGISGNFTYKLNSVTDRYGCASTANDSAVVVVNTQAVISAQSPATVQVCAPNPLVLSTIAPDAVAYQWRKSGVEIPGATAANYTKSTSAADSGNYSVIAVGVGGCNDTSTVSAVAISTLAAMPPAAAASATLLQADGMDISYTSAACEPIADITDLSGGNVLGMVNVAVFKDATVQALNGAPYLQRHFHIQPTNNGAATVKLYITQAEFDAYNAYLTANSPATSRLPTGPTDTLGLVNLAITQFHGLPTDGNTGPGGQYNAANQEYIFNSAITKTWNGAYWTLSFPVSGFSGFFIHSSNGTPLPLTLTSVAANNLGTTNEVLWSTADEEDGTRFEVERSLDAVQFLKIGTVFGTAQDNTSYRLVDEKPATGKNYYRVRAVALNGESVLSRVVVATVQEGTFVVEAFPNPTRGAVTVRLSAAPGPEATLWIGDISGKLLRRMPVTKAASELLLDDLAAGLYFLHYEDGSRSQVLRITKE